MNRKIKVRALLMRMRALRKLQLYEQSLRDGMAAKALMTATDQGRLYPKLKTEL
jgi:hypothetical protein